MKARKQICSLLVAVAMLLSLIPAVMAQGIGSAVSQLAITQRSVGVGNVTSVYLITRDVNMKVGETVEVYAGVEWLNDVPGTLTSSDVSWTTEDNPGNQIITVTPYANDPLHVTVTAVGIPETTQTDPVTLIVTVNGKKASITITVKPADTASVIIDQGEEVELEKSASMTLSAHVTPETSDQTVTWATSDPGIVAVDATTGKITAGTKPGKATITATSGALQDSIVVIVRGIVLEEKEITMREGDNKTLKYTLYGKNLKDNVQWSVDQNGSSAVRVTGGYVYALAVGVATVTAKVVGANYSDSCQITVTRKVADPVLASAQAGDPLKFSSIMGQIQTECQDVLEKPLSYISSLNVPTTQGTLYYRYYSDSDTGSGVGNGERYYVSPGQAQNSLSDLTFVPKSDFGGKAVIQYTGYASDQSFFQGTIEVTVSAQEDVTYATVSEKVIQFQKEDFNLVCRRKTGRELSYVILSLPDSSRGTLYYGYISESNMGSKVDSSKEYKYSGTPALGSVYFLPNAGYTGTVTIPYTGYNVNGESFYGRITVNVSAATGRGDLNYTIAQGGKITFSDSDFDDFSKSMTGYALDYVQFTLPPETEGTLYYDYSGSSSYASLVTAGRSYYANGTPYLRRVTFVANSNYAGTATVQFAGWDIKGNRFTGVVEIIVGQSANGDISYTVSRNQDLRFKVDDFNDLCRQLTGSPLDYVKFTLPKSSQGRLYYSYNNSSYTSEVTAARQYYRNNAPYIDNVSFVPARGYTGTVSIPITGKSTSERTFYGTVVITVDGSNVNLAYTVKATGVVTFDDESFDTLCQNETGKRLKYVRFDLPDASKGTLYYDYKDNSNLGTVVSESKSYYRTSSPYLDRVTFVPNRSYTGTFTISFTAWDMNGKSFRDTIQMTVQEPAKASVIYYSSNGSAVNFQSRDFQNACNDRQLGSLSYVKFDLPDRSQGRLFVQYDGSFQNATEVRSTTAYYPSGQPSIEQVSFVPKVGYSGTVNLTYTGMDTQGYQYTGSIQIAVQPGSYSKYFSDMSGHSWAVGAVDFLYENGVVTGVGNGKYGPSQSVSRGDFVLMLYQAFDLPEYTGEGFWDVPTNSYYAKAITAAKAMGIVNGFADNGFHPNAPISRQDAMLILQKTMQADGWSFGTGNTNLLSWYADGWAVADYAKNAMALMIEYGMISGDDQSKLNPNANTTRAEMAVILTNALTL